MAIEGVDTTMAERSGPRRKPIQMTVPDDARAVLDRVGNASDYVSRMVVERRREWSEALHLLVREGWHVHDVAFACSNLGSAHHPFEVPLPAWIAGQMRQHAPAEGKRRLLWLKACSRIEKEEPLARAMHTLAREWWAGNADVQVTVGLT